MTRYVTVNTVILKSFPSPVCMAVAPMSLPNYTNTAQESGHPPEDLTIGMTWDWTVPPTTTFNPPLALDSWVERGVNLGKGEVRKVWPYISCLSTHLLDWRADIRQFFLLLLKMMWGTTRLHWSTQITPALFWWTVKSVLGREKHHLFTVQVCPSPWASGHSCSFL